LPATSLQLEGPSLEPLLERVRAEGGPNARIVQADRVRRGGIAGFFTREHFEVIVELDDETGDVQDHADPGASSHLSHPDALEPDITVTQRWDDLLAGTDDVLQLSDPSLAHLASPGPAVPSTGTAPFADVLDEVARHNGVGPTPEEPAEASLEHHAGVGRRGPASGPAPEPAPYGHRGPASGPALYGHRGLVVTRPPAATMPGHAIAPSGGMQPVHAPTPAEGRRPGDTKSGGASPGTALATALRTVGLPLTFVPDAALLEPLAGLLHTAGAAEHIRVALAHVLEELPAPPRLPVRPGSVLCVAGEARSALSEARSIAAETGTEPRAVLLGTEKGARHGLAPHLVLRSADDVRELAAGWRRSASVVVVALDCPPTAGVHRWAATMLEALSPVALWGAVPATVKTDDVEAWNQALGGLDALALHRLEDTVSPTALLALGIPVVRLDKRHATPEAWASLLCERVARAARSAMTSTVDGGHHRSGVREVPTIP